MAFVLLVAGLSLFTFVRSLLLHLFVKFVGFTSVTPRVPIGGEVRFRGSIVARRPLRLRRGVVTLFCQEIATLKRVPKNIISQGVSYKEEKAFEFNKAMDKGEEYTFDGSFKIPLDSMHSWSGEYNVIKWWLGLKLDMALLPTATATADFVVAPNLVGAEDQPKHSPIFKR
ncbi:MAG: hypothetical protein ACUVXI_04490 [bacterium]